MMTRLALLRIVSGCWIALLLVACSSSKELKNFASDGCSLFPDSSVLAKSDWCGCCFDHDIAYWQGGTKAQRLQADTALRNCVLERTGDEQLARAMYAGVRMGGSPYFYNWYRWGYGWDYERKYGALTDEEQALVRKKLDQYFAEQ